MQLADGTVADQFADAVEVRIGMALHADLGGELVLFRQPVGAHHAGFLDGDGERLLAIDVQAAVQRPVGDEGVVVVGGADDHGVDVLLLEALPPVRRRSWPGETLERIRESAPR